MRQSLYDFCQRTTRLDLLSQWDDQRNGSLTPQDISYGSKVKAWWHCDKGHQWQAAIFSRTGGNETCPFCAGKRAWQGDTDLATRYPELSRQWSDRNGDLTPDLVLPGSHRMVWWKCEKGHQWQAVVKSRVSGTGCPVCANKRLMRGDNDLTVTHPSLAAQWHPTKNGCLLPSQVMAGSHKKVWWQCDKGHQWRASISSRAGGGVGCPVCAGKLVVPGENDLASLYPVVAAQWHPSKNDQLQPTEVSTYSNRRVWWRCRLGHEWQTTVAARTMNGSGCPYCSGKKVLPGFNDLATLEPKIAAQWYQPLNGELTPEMVTLGSNKKVWWQCGEGHVWQAVIYSRCGERKCGCPVCAGTVSKRRLRRSSLLVEDMLRQNIGR